MKQYTIILEQITDKKFLSGWSYLFYGVLMRKITDGYAGTLHEQTQTPITQHVVPLDKYRLLWQINLLTPLAVEKMENHIIELTNVYLERYEARFTVLECKCSAVWQESEFIQQCKEVDAAVNKAVIKIITPLAFKSQTEYVLFPTTELVLKSALAKWNCFNQQFSIDDAAASAALLRGSKIISYHLKSHYYELKGNKIPAFTGEFIIKARLPIPLLEVFKVLLLYTNYSGLGIKTALGMGAVQIAFK